MAKDRHYSPSLSRFILSALYHEAKARKLPMTKLTDQLLRQALMNTGGWREAERLVEESTPYLASNTAK